MISQGGVSDASAALRDRLIGELDVLQSADEAASWAHRNLPAKNTLTADDAKLIEAGFRLKLAAFSDAPAAEGPSIKRLDRRVL